MQKLFRRHLRRCEVDYSEYEPKDHSRCVLEAREKEERKKRMFEEFERWKSQYTNSNNVPF